MTATHPAPLGLVVEDFNGDGHQDIATADSNSNAVSVLLQHYTASSIGDPQFFGFLGQSFQFHGLINTVFNLLSNKNIQLNAKFIFLKEGHCPPINTLCFTHTGTYMGEIGILFNLPSDPNQTHFLKAIAGPHDKGMIIQLDGEEMRPDKHEILHLTTQKMITKQEYDSIMSSEDRLSLRAEASAPFIKQDGVDEFNTNIIDFNQTYYSSSRHRYHVIDFIYIIPHHMN